MALCGRKENMTDKHIAVIDIGKTNKKIKKKQLQKQTVLM